jgi:hypothetical protein
MVIFKKRRQCVQTDYWHSQQGSILKRRWVAGCDSGGAAGQRSTHADDLLPIERWALAWPALPTCGFALTEAERATIS